MSKKPLFIPGGQILTNLEEYSIKVQTEVDTYAKKVKDEVEELKKSAEIELEKSRKLKETIDDETTQIIDKANLEAEKIIKHAQDQGYKSGYAAAEQQFNLDLDKKIHQFSNIISELSTNRKRLYQEHEKEIVRLSIIIAQRIVYNQLRVDEDIVLNILKKSVSNLVGLGKIKIQLNSIDFEYIQKHWSEIKDYLDKDQQLYLIKADDINPGSIKMETDYSEINFDINNQFRKLAQEFEKIGNIRSNLLNKEIIND